MVEKDKIRSSNQKLTTTLPSGLVAVFVGATNGIGEYTIKAFVKYTVKPRVYLVGRSKEAAERIVKNS
jgi:NADP-dependent 3-hydroxy acid dehydrogenase YdfG